MRTESRFFIENDDCGKPLIINVEPECHHVGLANGERVTVHDSFACAPVSLHVEIDHGDVIISVWPGDGDVRVEKDGINLLELPVYAPAVKRAKSPNKKISVK